MSKETIWIFIKFHSLAFFLPLFLKVLNFEFHFISVLKTSFWKRELKKLKNDEMSQEEREDSKQDLREEKVEKDLKKILRSQIFTDLLLRASQSIYFTWLYWNFLQIGKIFCKKIFFLNFGENFQQNSLMIPLFS